MNDRDLLIELMLLRYCKDFVGNTAAKVIELNCVDELYSLATDNTLALPRVLKQQVIFRSAYTLEYIYINHPNLFIPFRERFLTDFVLCQNSRAKRHFSKIMTDILSHHTPQMKQMESIAETAAEWVSDPKVRVAVKIWAMSILKTLKPKVEWLDEIWLDLEEMMKNSATPAVEVRLKRGW